VTQKELAEASREELVEAVVEATRQVDEERDQRAKSDARLAEAEQQLRWFKKQLFGTKSERRPLVSDVASQLSLGEFAAGPRDEGQAKKAVVRAHERTTRPPSDSSEDPGLRFDDSVPVQTILVPNPELEGLEEDEIETVTEKVTYRLAQEPASYVVLKIVRQVVKRKDTEKLSCPPAPPAVLDKSYADVSVLAGLLIDKFRYHLPLYRQHQRMKAAGITVARSSLSNWVHRGIDLLEPIYLAHLDSILKSAVLAMDETPIRAGRKSKGKMRQAFFWPLYGDQDEVAFPYAASREHRHAEEILGDWCGTLISDGYEAYDRFAARREEVVHAQCWVHARRGFIKAEDVEPVRAGKALDLIGQLYRVEKEIRAKKLEGTAKLQMRSEEAKDTVAEFFAWIEEELTASALLPSNPFTRAANYVRKRRKDLEVFLADPDVPMDTNHLERALRVIPMGRKAWLFCWTEVGAEKVGQIQSLLTTCVLHDVDPYTYLVDVLQRIDTHPQSQVAELTPRLWKEHFAAQPLRSAIHRPPL
jgi:transposase